MCTYTWQYPPVQNHQYKLFHLPQTTMTFSMKPHKCTHNSIVACSSGQLWECSTTIPIHHKHNGKQKVYETSNIYTTAWHQWKHFPISTPTIVISLVDGEGMKQLQCMTVCDYTKSATWWGKPWRWEAVMLRDMYTSVLLPSIKLSCTTRQTMNTEHCPTRRWQAEAIETAKMVMSNLSTNQHITMGHTT